MRNEILNKGNFDFKFILWILIENKLIKSALFGPIAIAVVIASAAVV